jgi:glycosyltransferase involved in cell wall biosynthesis
MDIQGFLLARSINRKGAALATKKKKIKLIIQIPCFNEEGALPITLEALPRKIKGIDIVEWMIIDDGSTDNTVKVAQDKGVDHIVRLTRNQGLARAFMAGLEHSIKAGADIIVNTDADNQYNADDIPLLVEPILTGKAEMVIGARPIETISHFSPLKKILQKVGSWVVRLASRADIPDAPSGFRAISREAAMHLNVFNEYTYTLETIIQAGQKGMAMCSVPIRVNPDMRPSRLVRSVPSYIWISTMTIGRIFITYRPFRVFLTIGIILFLAGLFLSARFLVYWFQGAGEGHVQSLLLSAVLLISGFQVALTGLLADLMSVNRKMLEDLRFRQQEIFFNSRDKKEP